MLTGKMTWHSFLWQKKISSLVIFMRLLQGIITIANIGISRYTKAAELNLDFMLQKQKMVQLTHIGEQVIAAMFNQSEAVRRTLLSKVAEIDISLSFQAMPEVPLKNYGKYRFDGAHAIDIAVLFPDVDCGKCLGIEAKLGMERLTSNAFDGRFLKQCGTSHNGTRITGSMIAILEGKLPPECTGETVFVEHNKKRYSLLNKWVLIVRQRILDGWNRNGKPDLTDRCIPISFESIVKSYGDQNAFNKLVHELVDGDYYQEWIVNPDKSP